MRINFGRMLAHALARRIAALIVLALLAAAGINTARAATYANPTAANAACTAAAARAARDPHRNPTGKTECAIQPGSTAEAGAFRCRYEVQLYGPGSESFIVCANMGEPEYFHYNGPCPNGAGWNATTGLCAKDCSGQAPLTFNTTMRAKHGTHCFDGCEYLATNDPATPGWTISTVVPGSNACQQPQYDCLAGYVKTVVQPFGDMCVPQTCPAGQARNAQGQCERKKPDECPEGMVLGQDGTCQKEQTECPAGKVKGPDGTCVDDDDVCPAGQVKGPDGSCKKDEDDDGEADEDDGTFSGGENCDQPPQCSGDQIMCGQARIQWRIDCNTRKNRNISGGACGAMPICTGEKCDALEYSGLLMQWRTACALEKLAGKTGDSTDPGQPNWTKVDGMNKDPGQGATPGDLDVMQDREFNAASLDTSGFGGSAGSCPGFVASGGGGAIASGFLSTLASPPPFFCSLMGYLRPIVILLAVLAGLYINLRT